MLNCSLLNPGALDNPNLPSSDLPLTSELSMFPPPHHTPASSYQEVDTWYNCIYFPRSLWQSIVGEEKQSCVQHPFVKMEMSRVTFQGPTLQLGHKNSLKVIN